MFVAYSYTLIIFQIEYFNATFESVILERAIAQPYALTLPKRCYCWIRSLNQIWCEVYGLRQNAASFWKTTFSFFLRDSKAQKLFSFLLLYNSVQITHIFFCKKTFSFQHLFTNYKHQAIHQNLYTYSKEREKIFLPSDKKVLLSPPIMQVK